MQPYELLSLAATWDKVVTVPTQFWMHHLEHKLFLSSYTYSHPSAVKVYIYKTIVYFCDG